MARGSALGSVSNTYLSVGILAVGIMAVGILAVGILSVGILTQTQNFL